MKATTVFYSIFLVTYFKKWGVTKRVSHRGALLKEGLFRVLYQSILNAKLTGRKKLDINAQAAGMSASLRILSSKADSNTWELHKEWTEAGVSASRVTTLRHLQEKSYQTLLKQKHRQKHLTWATEKKNWTVAQWSKVIFSDESKCCISFVNQGPRVWRKRGETQNPCCLSPVWRSNSQRWFGLPCHLLVLVHCVFWSPQSTQPSTRKY